MNSAVQIKCPNCQNVLRVPPSVVDVSVRCKHCSFILQLKKKAAQAPPANVPVGILVSHHSSTAAVRSQPAVNGPLPSSVAFDELPEYTPPITPPSIGQRSFSAVIDGTIAPPHIVNDNIPAAAVTDYNPAYVAGQRHTGRGNYKGPRDGTSTKWIAVCSVLVIGGGVLAAALFRPHWFGAKDEGPGEQANNRNVIGPGPVAGGPSGLGQKAEDQSKPVPRRMLAVSINNYLYANALQYGTTAVTKDSERKDFYKATERLADGWRIPKTQRYYLADGPIEEGRMDFKHPPLKNVINGSLDSFLGTCRQQDRIVIIFSGHAIENEGEAYLVPLEGEFEDIPSLIPLKEIYAKLAKCPAQEKLIIFDVCRFDPGRGVERPAFGKMTEGLEKAFHEPPPGVAVWTSCSQGQYSYEYEFQQIDLVGVGNREMFGSIFFSMFFAGHDRGAIFGKRQGGAGIHHPADPLPIEPVTTYVNDKTAAVVREIEKKAQTPKLTIVPRKEEWVAYRPEEPPAAKFELTKPPATARREEVVAMFKELELPSIKAIRKDESRSMKLADSFPFTEAQVKSFFNDKGPTFDDIAKAPAKYAEEFPLRAAAVEALVEMRKLRGENAKDELPEEFRSPISDATKKTITDKFQRTITERQGILDELREKLDAVAKKREMEKSKRWLATFDYTMFQVKARLAYIFEYNLAMGNVKTDKLPELEPKHKGWKLASVEKMTSPKEIRDLADEAKNGFTEIVMTYPHSPWAVMSKAQKNMAYGLKWEPASFGADESEAAKAP